MNSVFNLLHLNNQNIGVSDEIISDFEYGIVLKVNNDTIAQGGLVSSEQTKSFGIKNEVFFVEIDWSLLKELSGKHRIKYVPVPKFPQMRRDLSLLLDNQIQFGQIEELARKVDRKLLKDVNLFDVYEGKNLPKGKKSYAVSFTFQHPDKTLTDKQVDKIMQKMIKELGNQLNAELR